MNSKNILLVVAALVVGVVIGYCCTTHWSARQVSQGNCPMMGPNMAAMSGMEHQMMTMTDRMKGKTGGELDRIFLEDMIVHHQGAVDMAQMLVKETERPELQKMGADIIKVQTAEIAQMQQWLQSWFK